MDDFKKNEKVGKIGDIERLRGFAVLMTVFAHMPLITSIFKWAAIPSPLWIGVPLFFVISGYVITISVEKYTYTVYNFYVRRICRILPVLLVSILITLFMAFFTGDAQFYGTYPGIISTIASILGFFIITMCSIPCRWYCRCSDCGRYPRKSNSISSSLLYFPFQGELKLS